MKKQLISILIAIAFLANCGGLPKKLAPLKVPASGDTEKTCPQLEDELALAGKKAADFQEIMRQQAFVNVAYLAMGLMLMWPMLFLIDTSSKDEANYANYANHYNYLLALCQQKGCDIKDLEPITIESPSKTITANQIEAERGYRPGDQ